jgi:signal transduction histidine kinase
MLTALRIVLTAVLLLHGSAHALEPVKLQLNWLHQFEFAGFYAAVEKGFYREAGLEVTIIEGGPQIDSTAVVAAGAADFGVGSSSVLIERSRGRDLVVLGVIFQHSPAVLLALADSGINSLKDLAGKRLMDSPNAADVVAMLKRAGVDYAALPKVPHHGDPRALIAGEADAMIAYGTNEPFVLGEMGVPYKLFSARSSGIDFYGNNIFGSGKTVRQRPEMVRAFRAATFRGWQYALDHPDEIIDLILARYSSHKSRTALAFEANETALLIQPELIELGYQSASRWEYIASVHEDIGMGGVKAGLPGLIYDPTPPPDNTRLWLIVAAFAAATLVLGLVATTLQRLNSRLRAEIDDRHRIEAELRTHRDHLNELVRIQTLDLVQAKDLAETANQAKDIFLSNMSHELRTPVHQILALARLGESRLAGNEESGALRHLFEKIQTAGLRMERLVVDLLELAHARSGSRAASLVQHDLVKMCQNAIAAEQASAERKQISLRLAESPPALLRCDPARIEQVIRYLLGNAIQFSPVQGLIELTVTGGDGLWRLSIADTGPGIPEDELERIFEAFVQGSRTTNGSGGKGLGLAVCRQILSQHGGSIRASNRQPSGAVFEFTLPA